MRLAFLCFVIAACKGDEADTSRSDDSGSPTDDSGTVDDSATGGDDTGTADDSATGADDTGADDSGADDSGTDDSGTDTGSEDCTDDVVLEILTTHLADLATSGALLEGHASESEAVALFVLPGYVGTSAQYATLIAPCSKPLLYDPWCDVELCWQLECTGKGAGVITHGWLASPPIVAGDVELTDATVDTEWVESSDEVVYHLVSTSTGPDDVDLSVDGTGTLAPDGTTTLVETYAGLGLTLTATLSDAAVIGELVTGKVVVASTDSDGHLVATGDCP